MKNPLVPFYLMAAIALTAAYIAHHVPPGQPPAAARTPKHPGKPEAWITCGLEGAGTYPFVAVPFIKVYKSVQAAQQIERLDARGDAETVRRLDLEKYFDLARSPARVWLLEERPGWAKVEVVYGESEGCIGWVRSKMVVKVKPIK